MKSLSIFSVITVLCFRSQVECFFTYPISRHVLNEFLKVLSASDMSFEKDLLNHAVDGAKCMRECRENDRKICYFNFTLKHYQTLGGLDEF